MKKGLKLGVTALAILGFAVISMMSTNDVNAAKTVRVTLTNAITGSSCNDIADFEFTGNVSSSAQTLGPKQNDLVCEFNKTTQENVTIISSNLSGPQTINSGSVTMTTTSTCKTQAGLTDSTCKQFTDAALSAAKTVMTKPENKIGTATHTIKLKVAMPAYAPQGSYNGTLTITVQ